MQILNVHKRTFYVPIEDITDLLSTIASENDLIWPKGKWPKMKLNNGLKEGSKGGHGPIRYFVESYIPNKTLVFRFTQPKGFKGVHKFELNTLDHQKTELVHTIEMEARGFALLQWYFGIRWLHDALIEDGLDKMHNHITGDSKRTTWNLWVKILRSVLK
ncbi:MAG: hypothetical protein AAGA77_20940 [Bacteroidota bacterium]